MKWRPEFHLNPLSISIVLVSSLGALPALADMLVARTTGSGLAANVASGKTLPTGTRLSVPAGSSVTLVLDDGRMLTLTGPYAGVPDASTAQTGHDTKGESTLSRILTPRNNETNSLGAIRGSSHIPDPKLTDTNNPRDQVKGTSTWK